MNSFSPSFSMTDGSVTYQIADALHRHRSVLCTRLPPASDHMTTRHIIVSQIVVWVRAVVAQSEVWGLSGQSLLAIQ